MVGGVTEWIQEVNGKHMKERVCQSKRNIHWWTKEVNDLKRHVRKCRKALQKARKDGREYVKERMNIRIDCGR